MYRRRRTSREIPFSFDSFLDVVANVVGVIIRLILVVWVGARSYTGIAQLVHKPEPTAAALPEPADPLEDELKARRRELAALQKQLTEDLRQLQSSSERTALTQQELAALSERSHELESQASQITNALNREDQTARSVALSSEELRNRCQRIAQEVRELEKLPSARKALRYRTPVSKPVESEELLFECQGGRVTFIDLAPLLAEVRRDMEDRKQELRRQWQVEGRTPPSGAFRLHYFLERERGPLDVLGVTAPPDSGESFRYGLSVGQLEPVQDPRGETVQRAMQPDSEFRQIVDFLDPKATTVTLWVYPDSFALYRSLRDYLADRGVVVAGRPLPDGVLIGCSRQGSVSRGQ